eukprot:750044-Hanusia_phi.AAC.2
MKNAQRSRAKGFAHNEERAQVKCFGRGLLDISKTKADTGCKGMYMFAGRFLNRDEFCTEQGSGKGAAAIGLFKARQGETRGNVGTCQGQPRMHHGTSYTALHDHGTTCTTSQRGHATFYTSLCQQPLPGNRADACADGKTLA